MASRGRHCETLGEVGVASEQSSGNVTPTGESGQSSMWPRSHFRESPASSGAFPRPDPSKSCPNSTSDVASALRLPSARNHSSRNSTREERTASSSKPTMSLEAHNKEFNTACEVDRVSRTMARRMQESPAASNLLESDTPPDRSEVKRCCRRFR